MRELYATELRSQSDRNDAARRFVTEWVDRHVNGEQNTAESSIADNDDGSCIATLRQVDEGQQLEWRSEVSLGAPSDLTRVTVRIRVGSLGGEAIRPIDYEFGTPAIVRTLLRELDIRDGAVRCLADLGAEVGPSDVGELVDWLADANRGWPVVVVSRSEPAGATLLDPQWLSRELAGLAHVRVLSSSAASWELTRAIGKDYSVWNGAVRVFFPGFSADSDDYRRHQVTYPDRVGESTVLRLRAWLGTLAAAATGEHPALRAQREKRRELALAAVAADDPAELRDWVNALEEDNARLGQDVKDYKQQVAELRKQQSATESELEQVRNSFAEVQRSLASTTPVDANDAVAHGWPSSVAEAMDAVEHLAENPYYRRGVILTRDAVRSGRGFVNYARPLELLRACHAVLEAGVGYHDNTLGTSPGQLFSNRGFGYGAQPSPHLKVDEYTSPDQCLRIYWTDDPANRVWTITSVGPHA